MMGSIMTSLCSPETSHRSAIQARGLIAVAVALITTSGCYSIAPNTAVPSAAAETAPALPDMQNLAKPNPEPAAPSGWDVFAPRYPPTPRFRALQPSRSGPAPAPRATA